MAQIPTEDWLIGMWHSPCYGDITYKDSYLSICAPWLEKFYAHGCDFILHGHAHTYVRSHPLLPDGTVDVANGMVHIVNGCGGASFKTRQTVTEKTAYTPSQTSFACVTMLTFDNNTALVRTVDVRTLINYGTIDEWTWDRTTNVESINTSLVENYALEQCYPNPFNPNTTIRYRLPRSGNVRMAIYDITGKEVSTLIDEIQNSGRYILRWSAVDDNGKVLPRGLYLLRFQSGGFADTQKLILMR